ncbi:MAG TPA: hypothetical protein PKG81_04390, partial [Candidatus Omnitrophota bacterium]|nr:hypothetical protein [Candidatus Omnitrophota bacterium]
MSDKVKLSRAVELISKLSIDKASQVFSKLIKSGARIELEKAYVADISEATAKIAADNNEVVGVYVDIVGDIPLKFLFYV